MHRPLGPANRISSSNTNTLKLESYMKQMEIHACAFAGEFDIITHFVVKMKL